MTLAETRPPKPGRPPLPPDEPDSEALRELAPLPRWVVWRYEFVKGKWTKVPYRTDGARADSTDAATWTTYARALSAARSGRFDGVGFVLDGSGIVGWDFDHCVDPTTGEIDQTTWRRVRRLGSYSEVTPSGTGVRVFAKGVLPPGGRKAGPVECYEVARYLTVTGQHLEGTPTTIEERQDALAELHAEVFGAAPTPNGNGPVHLAYRETDPARLSDDELIARIRASDQGEKFDRLFDRGDRAGYPSESEPDLALACILAFWTRNDAPRITRLLRRSALRRDKWDRPDYLPRTVARAVEMTTETYGDARFGSTRIADKTDKTPVTPLNVSFVSDFGPPENADWPVPDTITGAPPAPPLPLNLLPREVAEVASDVADRQQSPPDFVAWPLVVSTAALVGREVGIRPLRLDDWTEQPALWVALLGRPSTLKTPALNEGSRPLRRQQARDSQAHAEALAEWAAECAEIRQENPKAKDHDLPPKPVLRRCFTSDATVEKLATMLVPDVSRGLAVVRDELAGLVLDMNKYAKGGDRQFWLQAYTGGAYVVDRLSRESVFVPDLLASLVGGVQPAVAPTVFGNGPDDGFSARLMAIWPDEPTTFTHVERVPNKAARDALDAVNDKLAGEAWYAVLNRDDFGPVPFCRPDADGLTLFAEWRSGFLTDLRAAQHDDRLAARLGKYPGLVARLVLLFHLHEWAAGRAKRAAVADAETVVRVLELVTSYLRPMDERVYRRFAIPPAADGGRRIAAWLVKTRPSVVTAREVQRRGWSGLTSAQEVAASLEWLVVHGWLREADPEARPGRPSNRFLVNPRLPEAIDG